MPAATQIQTIRNILLNELPKLIETDPSIRSSISRVGSERYADKRQTEDHVDRILDELKADRERSDLRWQQSQSEFKEFRNESKEFRELSEQRWQQYQREYKEFRELSEQRWQENQEKWQENQEKWQENRQVIQEMLAEIKQIKTKQEASIGALGARWGLQSESAFRNGLKAILENSFHVKVERYADFDQEGMVFGRPDQVELDVIIFNSTVILCELKASMSKSDMYAFWRKAQFYEKQHQRRADRLLAISPMIDDKAKQVAKELQIETYSYSEDVVI